MVMKRDRHFLIVLVALFAVAVCASLASHAAGTRGTTNKGKTMDDHHHAFTLTLHCNRTYLAGFPFIVAVEARNTSSNQFELLPFFDLFTVPGPVSFVLRGGGHEWTWNTKARRREGEPEGMEFGPGKAWFALQDLSELHPDLPPGHYDLTATLLFMGEQATSQSAPVEIQAPSKQDHAIVAKLRAKNGQDKPSWGAFVEDNWSTPDVHGLSPAARAELAFHLYLHRVTYGPDAVAALDPEGASKFAHGALESTSALIRLEILRAKNKPEAEGVEAAILERWPGLAWWVEQIHNDSGLLARLRSSNGVDSGDAPTDKPRPYQKTK